MDGNPGSVCALLPLSQPAFESFDLETSQLSVYHYYLHPTHAEPIIWVREMDESESIQMVLEKVKWTYFDAYLLKLSFDIQKSI